MYRAMRRVRSAALILMVACFALAPAATRAEEVVPPAPPPAGGATLNFLVPKGWTDATRPTDRPGLWKDWTIRDGATVHSLVLSVTRETRRALPYGEAAIVAYKALPNVKMLDFGPTTTCGDVPAFAYTYRSDRTPDHPLIIRHVLVDIGSVLGDVSYAHPPGIADRADAIDAMSTLCERTIFAMRAPAGWSRNAVPGITAKDAPGVDGFTAPAGTGVLIALATSEPVRRSTELLAPTRLLGPGSVVSDVEEQCGALRVKHTVIRAPGKDGAGPRILETVAGYRHGANYLYSYVHPEAERADPDAQRALTSFCDAGATPATPAPLPRQPA